MDLTALLLSRLQFVSSSSPLILLYTVISYTVFRGKIRPTTDHY
jgi:hypothetical protein